MNISFPHENGLDVGQYVSAIRGAEAQISRYRIIDRGKSILIAESV